MVPSDVPGPPRRVRPWLPLVVVIVIAGLILGWRALVLESVAAHFGSGFDAKRFDRLEADFGRDRAAFVAADARMQPLVAAHPAATRISWSLTEICVSDGGLIDVERDCTETGPADRSIFAALPNADLIVHQAKDDGRTFFRFYREDPPRYTIMHAPADPDPGRYADDHGFRGTRPLERGWTVLGPIADDERDEQQWSG